MNRNYRVVFNQSTGTYVAVAENTSARKKSKTTVKTIIASLSVSAMLMGASSAAHASFVGDNSNTHYGNNHIVIGQGAQVGSSNKDNPAAAEAIAIGVNAKALGNNAIALGYNAHVGKGTIQSIAIGSSAKATGTQSTAIGNDTYATGHSSVAIGGDDVNEVIKAAGKEYTALTGVVLVESQWQNTESKGHGSVAIGVQSLAEGNFSTALGMTAKTQGTGSVAFGANARGLGKGATGIGTASQAIAQQATAIGMNSAATAQNATAIGSGGNTPETATKATADGAIAIGGNSVKGSQATGKNAIAIGGESEASKDNAIAIGAGSKSTHGNSVALGVNSVATGVNIGNAAWQPKDAAGNPIAVVGNATGEVSIGKGGSERRITNMAAGSADTDGVNVSQLKALDSALTSNVNALTNNLAKVDGKVNNLQTSVNTLEQGWKLKSDGDVATAVKAGNTVAINSGTNIDVARTGNTITVNTTQDMTLNSVSFSDTAGNNSVLSASGLKVNNSTTGNTVQYGSDALTFIQNGNTANTVSVGTTGISAGNQTISNVANGALNAASKDAVNGSQLHKTNQDLTQVSNQVNQNTGDIANLSQGWKLQSNNDTASAVKAGDTVQFNSGKNIDVSRNGNTLTIATADDLNLNSVSLQDASGNVLTTLDASGLNVKNSAGSEAHYGAEQLVFNAGSSNSVSIGNTGINAGNQTITNVADGAINSSSKDAINGSQLYNIQQEVQEHIKKAEDEAGLLGSLAVMYDTTDKDHITLGGANATSTVGISNLADGKVEAGSTEAITGNQLYQTNTQVNQNTADIANLSQGWNLQSDGDAASKVAAGDTVQINSGNNIDVSRNGNILTIATAADMALSSVTLTDASTGNSSVINGNALVFNQGTANAVSIGNTGVNAGNQTITNVADGAINSVSKDAINGSQLYNIQQEMQEHIKKAEDEAGLLGSLAVMYDSPDKDHITLGGANATSTVGISNLANGKVEAGSKDAVNGGQLYAVDQKVDQNTADITHLSQGWKIQSDGDTASSVVAGDTVQFNSGKNIDVSRDGNTLTIATADDLNLSSVSLQDASGKTLTTLDTSGLNVNSADGSSNAHYGADQLVFNQGSANAVSVGETGINAGNQIISNVAAGDISSAASTEAVNGGQLYQTNQNIAQNKDAIDHLNQGWKLQSDSDIASAVKAGDTVQINSGTNIDVSRVGNTLTIATANDLTLGSITTVDGSGKSSILDTNGLQVDSGNGAWASYGAGSSIINDGQGNQASSTATGVVVTDSQNNTTQVGSKGVLLLNPDGSEMANLSQQQLSFSNGNLNNDVTIGMNGISAGNQKITNVAAGVLGVDSKDAVNGGQLYQTNQNVTDLGDQIANLNQGWKLQSDGDSETAIRAGDTVAINSGKNIQVERVGKDITIHTSDDLVVNSVVADDGTGNTMTLTATGIDLQDAAGNTYITTAAGSELTNANGDITHLTAAGTEVTDALGNNATYGANGISIGNTTGGTVISIKDGDVNFGGNVINGVGDGVTAGDAVNKGQLDGLGDSLSNLGMNFAGNAGTTHKNLGQTLNIEGKATTAGLYSGSNVKTEVDGNGVLQIQIAENPEFNSVIAGDTASGNFSVIGSGGTTVTDAAGNVANYGANSSSFTDTAGNSNISSATGTTLTDAAGNTYITTAAGSELTNANGDQTKLSAVGTYVQDALGNNATYGANGISIGNTTGGTVISIKDGDVNFGGNTLGGVGAGVNPDDAINKGQLDNLGDHLAGDIFGGNATYDGNTITWSNIGGTGENTVDGAIDSVNKKVNLGWNAADTAGNTFNVAAGQTVSFINSDGNIDITAAGSSSSLTFDLAKDINVNSVTADDGLGNKTVLGSTGTSVSDAAGNNAHYGANSSSFTDTAGNSNISSATGMTLTDAAGNTYITTAAGSELTNANGDQTNLSAAGTYVQDALGNNATYGANGISIADAAGNLSTNIGAGNIIVGGNTHTIAIDGNTGEITGLGNTAYDPSNVQADRAATEGQLQDALKQISQQGFGVSAQGGVSDTVALGETVDFASKDGNIAVSTGVDNQILFQLSDSLNVSNITMQDANGNVNYSDVTGNRVQDVFGNNAFYGAIGNVFTDKAGNSFNNSAAGSHISNSNGDVTHVTAAGTQVSDAAGNNANYGATGNTITNAAGDSTNVSAGNITVGTGNGGSVSIGGNGIDAGGNQITNVADGKAAGDAVNKGQLDQAVNDINNSIGAVNNSGVQYDKNADGTINKDSITLAGGANGTTITNVANGKVEAGSKDAVNGGQLHDALQQINNNQSTINNDILGITTGPDGKPKLDLDIYDVANQTKTGDLTLVDAINTVNQEGTKYAHTNAADESEEPGLINPDNNAASAGGKNSSAFGVNAIVDDTATNGLAMGYQSQVGEGATNAVSIGSQTQANGESSLAMGHGSQANGKQSISIGTGNTVNGNHSGAIGDPSTVNGDGSYSIGNNNTIDVDNSFVLGNEVTISKDATDMSKANGATFGGSVGLGNGSTVDAAIGTKNVTIGDTTYGFAGSAPVGTISVGGKNAERTITNVAAGRIDATSTDAINGSQLYATNQAVDSLIKGEAGPVQYVKDGDGKAQNVVNLKGDADSNAPVTLSNVADGKAPNDAVNVGQMQKMGDKINARIDGLEDESRAGVATALAVANLPQVYIPGKSGLAIATGVHKGEVGYALGYSSISEGGNWVFKASATANRMGDVGGGAGLLYMFD